MEDEENWRDLIAGEMAAHGETWNDYIASTLTESELNEKFDSSYGGEEGNTFTVWTINRVYFPVCYDGAEWCGSTARNYERVYK